MSDDLFPEPRVGVVAARTFYVEGGRFQSVNASHRDGGWDTGVAQATCKATLTVWRSYFYQRNLPDPDPLPVRAHEAPADDCTCGIYSFATAHEVAAQYAEPAGNLIAAIAPEGHAIEGSKGWRSASARILSAWVKSEDDRVALAENYPDVLFFEDLQRLFDEYPSLDGGEGVAAYELAVDAATGATQGWMRVPGLSAMLTSFTASAGAVTFTPSAPHATAMYRYSIGGAMVTHWYTPGGVIQAAQYQPEQAAPKPDREPPRPSRLAQKFPALAAKQAKTPEHTKLQRRLDGRRK